MELPRLEPVYRKYQNSGLEIIAIDIYGSDKRAKEFIETNDMTFTFLSGNIDLAVEEWKIDFTPATFVIDKSGTVVSFHPEFHAGDEVILDEEIGSLIDQQ